MSAVHPKAAAKFAHWSSFSSRQYGYGFVLVHALTRQFV
jgi:hypothetical protein